MRALAAIAMIRPMPGCAARGGIPRHRAYHHERGLMSDHAFDTIARRAAETVSRRRSLLNLGGAALVAGLVLPASAPARAGGKGKGKDRCKSQVGKCREGVFDLCLIVYGEDVAECVDLYAPCCEFLKDCETARAFACAVEKADVKEA